MKMKFCSKCHVEKLLTEFTKDSQKKDGLRPDCKECNSKSRQYYLLNHKKEKADYDKEYRKRNREKIKEDKRLYRIKNKEKITPRNNMIHEKYPWKRVLTSIKQRCNNKNNTSYEDYGKRGIKCLITEEEIKHLWFRDKAYLMKKPSIDRINNDGNYIYDNRRFIEFVENNIKDKRKPVLQYNIDGKFIREFKSSNDAGKFLNVHSTNIRKCCRFQIKTAYNFIWRYKNV